MVQQITMPSTLNSDCSGCLGTTGTTIFVVVLCLGCALHSFFSLSLDHVTCAPLTASSGVSVLGFGFAEPLRKTSKYQKNSLPLSNLQNLEKEVSFFSVSGFCVQQGQNIRKSLWNFPWRARHRDMTLSVAILTFDSSLLDNNTWCDLSCVKDSIDQSAKGNHHT